MGGDGLVNEVLNGLLLQTQAAAGVTLRRLRTVPVSPSIRLGVVPAGFTNSIARSILGSSCPSVAAAQIMLGECSSREPCFLRLRDPSSPPQGAARLWTCVASCTTVSSPCLLLVP